MAGETHRESGTPPPDTHTRPTHLCQCGVVGRQPLHLCCLGIKGRNQLVPAGPQGSDALQLHRRRLALLLCSCCPC